MTLTCEITPRREQDGDVHDVEAVFHASCKLPVWRCASRPLAVTRGGQLVFSEDAPDNPYQTTIDEVTGEDD